MIIAAAPQIRKRSTKPTLITRNGEPLLLRRRALRLSGCGWAFGCRSATALAAASSRAGTAGVTTTTVAPGDTPIDEIIANTERGIILARFSGGIPNAQLDFSGVAKNSFYVEDGMVRYPLVETMVSGNFQKLLMNVRALSRETVNFGDGAYPYMAASGVTISSK